MAGDATRPAFKAQQVTRPRAQVEAQIKEAIFLGQFAPGDKLPAETELAEQFGVSRPTIREALASLASAGLIRKVPGVAGGSCDSTSPSPRHSSPATPIVRQGRWKSTSPTTCATPATSRTTPPRRSTPLTEVHRNARRKSQCLPRVDSMRAGRHVLTDDPNDERAVAGVSVVIAYLGESLRRGQISARERTDDDLSPFARS
jgi:DNA-binding transcriptional MocR family regulator